MSKYKIGEKDDWDFRLVRREERVEMWHKPETNSYMVCLYEHINRDEERLFHTTKFSQEEADWVFETVVGLLRVGESI
jgi:hypothetical protein